MKNPAIKVLEHEIKIITTAIEKDKKVVENLSGICDQVEKKVKKVLDHEIKTVSTNIEKLNKSVEALSATLEIIKNADLEARSTSTPKSRNPSTPKSRNPSTPKSRNPSTPKSQPESKPLIKKNVKFSDEESPAEDEIKPKAKAKKTDEDEVSEVVTPKPATKVATKAVVAKSKAK